MSNSVTLCFNQLLDAVKIELLQQQLAQSQKKQHHELFCKFGEDYQDRLIMPKMRYINMDAVIAGSAGSSRRSTPTDSIFSNCSSTHSSSPNSPPSLLQIPTVSQPSAFLSVASSTSPSLILPHQFNSSSKNSLNVPFNILDQQHNSSHAEIIATSATASCSTMSSTTTLNSNFLNNSRSLPTSTSVSLSVRQSRAAHNELEKNRRANLRGYLDKLKTVLPFDSDSTRDTTLSLLTRARNHLNAVKHEKEELLNQRQAALAELLRLRQELETVKVAEEAVSVLDIKDIKTTVAKQQSVVEMAVEVSAVSATRYECDQSSLKSKIVAAPSTAVNQTAFAAPPLSAFKNIKVKEEVGQPAVCAALASQVFNATKSIDLYMEGLLPALPLLYPYQDLILRHAAFSLC